MNCCVTELKNKEVICVNNGCRLGNVSDVEICAENGQLTAIIIWGKSKCLGLMGREEDIRISWKDIKIIGDETILVHCDACNNPRYTSTVKKNPMDFLFR